MKKPATKPALDARILWRLQRIGAPALSPDGTRVVGAVTTHDTEQNRAATRLWLLPTDRAAPRPLTLCGDKDGQPAWSPRGDRIAFVAKRDGPGRPDATPQLYLIAADGGEARRVSDFAPGVEGFKWLPDGRRIAFSAWVWPDARGAAAQSRRHKAFTERRESGYATGQAFYRHWDRNLPEGRVLHLLLLDLASGRVTDLFEGTALELPRDGGDASVFDPSPDGRAIAFVHDPAPVPLAGNRRRLSEIDLRTRRVTVLADDPDWDFGAPAYAPDGGRIAMTAANVGRHHTALDQPALLERAARGQGWRLLAPGWDRSVDAPLRWGDGGRALLFTAEDRGRRPLWQLRPGARAPEVVVEGGWVQGFDVAPGLVVTAADSARHPVRVHAHRAGAAPLRLETFNDAVLDKLALGGLREVEVVGALGEPVQMWLTFPPGFDAKRKHPVLQVVHGGPHAAAGDTFGYRWNPHVLASRGHVVAQVNYHGSSGFGWAFRHSLIGRQGDLELQDIEAGSDWLLAQRWADRRRVHASGGSYGGFLVAWMNGHLPGGPRRRYRAYVCHAGVFDRIASFSADSWPVRPKDLGARYWDDMPRVLAQSPHAFAGRMDTPTLVIHGAKDYRVPDGNGLAYYNTLKARGVEARLLWFPDENHWVLKPRNSLQWYGEFLDWVTRPHH